MRGNAQVYVQQVCHAKPPFGFTHVMEVPWNQEELNRMNEIQRAHPSLLYGCGAPYPHTHHFNFFKFKG
jgi:hypothetical protein